MTQLIFVCVPDLCNSKSRDTKSFLLCWHIFASADGHYRNNINSKRLLLGFWFFFGLKIMRIIWKATYFETN